MFGPLKELLLLLYGMPFLVADAHRHPHTDRISKLNLYAGWTGIGWLAVLAWALWRPGRRAGGQPRGGELF